MGLTTQTQAIIDLLNETAAIALETAAIAQESARYQAEMALEMAITEAQGLEAQLLINQATTEANVVVDLANLGTRSALLLSSKAQELGVLIAQYREKTLGLFLAILDQRTNTVWARMKQMSQGFKF